jgi:hypothetical protein
MCEPASAAYAAALIGGTYLQQDAANDAAKRQQSAINSALEQQDNTSRKAEGVAMNNAQEYAPQTRLGRFEAAREGAGDSLVTNLTQARDQQALSGGNAGQAGGRLSQEFTTGRAAAAADEFQRSIDTARLMGKMRGSTDMLQDEGMSNANYALQGGMLASQAGREYRAAQPGINAAGRPNGTQMFIGGATSGLGSAGLVNSMGKNGRTSTTGAS